jgi:hypothetical protein
MSTSLTLHSSTAAATSAMFSYRGIDRIEKVEDITECVHKYRLSEEEHDSLCYEVAIAYLSASRKMEQLADPLIAYYADRCTTRNINMQSVLSEQDCTEVNRAAARWKERIHRRKTLIYWFNENKWDIRHPYIQAVLHGNIYLIKAFNDFINKVLWYNQDYVMLNISHYILFRIANGIKYSSRDLGITTKDLDVLSITIKIKKQQALLATEQRQWEARGKSGGEVFNVSDRPISKEDIEAAQLALGSLIRIDVEHTLLAFGTDDPSVPEIAPSRATIDNQQALVRTRSGAVHVNKDDEEWNLRSRAHTATGKRARNNGDKQKVRTHEAADIANWERRCRCDQATNAIPQGVRENIVNLESTVTLNRTAEELAAVRQAAVDVAFSIGNMDICHSHCFIFASHTSIYKASKLHAQLLQIIRHYGQQVDIKSYLASDEAALLIKKGYREPNPYDDAGLAQIIATPQPQMYNLDKQTAADIIEEMFPSMKDIWERDGDVVSDIFGWIFQDKTLANCIQAEVNMYDYHFRPKAGQSKKGWLRNANFTQIQQLIRMDLVFYTQHVLLHEDHAVRFISYPYEMKLAMLGMSTAFSHLDLNVTRVIEDLDGSRAYPVRKYIQTAVTLTDEDKHNCTKIIPKMHKEAIFRDWAKDQPKNTNAINAGVSFTEDHAKKYTTRFRYDILKAGESRMSDPRCLHGTDGPATMRRVVVFAWLVEHDGQSLLQPGTGSVEELGRAHRDLLLGPKLNSPSGYPNKSGIPIEKFPASMQLFSPSAISNAIVGRIPYSDISVQSKLVVLFGDDNDARVKLIDNTRKQMLAQVKKNYNCLFKLEEEIFGEKSFSRNKNIFEKSFHLQRHAVLTFPEELDIANITVRNEGSR